MARIYFKATRKKHQSGFALINKRGDLQFDQDKNSKDGIWFYLKSGGKILIDCDYKTKEFKICFSPNILLRSE